MKQQDMTRILSGISDQVSGLLSEHEDEIMDGYLSSGEDVFRIDLGATLKSGNDDITRKVTISFATGKVKDHSVEKTSLNQLEMFEDGEKEPANAAH